jgi:hypothetical protein
MKPCGKQIKRSRGAADAQMRALLNRPEHLRDGELLNVYLCLKCSIAMGRNAYHVGHRRESSFEREGRQARRPAGM